jgi:hypothetical protein
MDNVMALKRVEGNKPKMKRKAYEQELRKLQIELCKEYCSLRWPPS